MVHIQTIYFKHIVIHITKKTTHEEITLILFENCLPDINFKMTMQKLLKHLTSLQNSDKCMILPKIDEYLVKWMSLYLDVSTIIFFIYMDM